MASDRDAELRDRIAGCSRIYLDDPSSLDNFGELVHAMCHAVAEGIDPDDVIMLSGLPPEEAEELLRDC